MSVNIKKWIWEEQRKHHRCNCGCKQYIIIKRFHYYDGIPQKIVGHSLIKNWIQQEQGKHFCQCGCGEEIKLLPTYYSRGIPKTIKGHKCNKVEKWCTQEQGKHFCACGCGGEIQILPHHHSQGIPKFIKHHFSKEIIEKRCIKTIGQKRSKETRKKMSESHKGQKLSEEHKRKISESQIGRIGTMLGKKHSEETKLKMSESNKHLSGKNHPQWKGGISFEPYCQKFNNQLKEKIRNRDNNICQLCGKTKEKNKINLTVHHIHYDKENCYPDLITLCKSCNSKVNKHRDYWEEYFMRQLAYRGLVKIYSLNEIGL